MPNAQGRALTIGLNAMGRGFAGYDPLTTAEADAKDIAAIAKSRGFATKTLLGTARNPRGGNRGDHRGGRRLRTGDIFLLSFSGHGDQVPDRNRDETDVRDEAWLLYDRKLIDDELFELWQVQVRSPRPGPLRQLPQRDDPHGRLRGPARRRRRQHKANRKKVKASVLLISACQDNEKAYESGSNQQRLYRGAQGVWDNGRFRETTRRSAEDRPERLDSQSPTCTPSAQGRRPLNARPHSRFDGDPHSGGRREGSTRGLPPDSTGS